MKQNYVKPSMKAVETKKVNLLVGSKFQNVNSNANLIYKGPGTNIARSHVGDGGDYDGDWGEDEE